MENNDSFPVNEETNELENIDSVVEEDSFSIDEEEEEEPLLPEPVEEEEKQPIVEKTKPKRRYSTAMKLLIVCVVLLLVSLILYLGIGIFYPSTSSTIERQTPQSFQEMGKQVFQPLFQKMRKNVSS